MAELPAAIRRCLKELASAGPPSGTGNSGSAGVGCPAQPASDRLPWLLMDIVHVLEEHGGAAGLGHPRHELEQVQLAAEDWSDGVAQAASLLEVVAHHAGARAALATVLACNGRMTALCADSLSRCSRATALAVATDVWREFAQRASAADVQQRMQQLGDDELDPCLPEKRACWEQQWQQRRRLLVQAVEDSVLALAAGKAMAELAGELDSLAESHAGSIAACLQAAAGCSGELGQQAAACAAELRHWHVQAQQPAGSAVAVTAELVRALVSAAGPVIFPPLALAKVVQGDFPNIVVCLHDEQECLLPHPRSPSPGRFARSCASFFFRFLTSDMLWPQAPVM
jgi:hypothetical protein